METQLNSTIKKFVFEALRKTPNIENMDSVLQAIEAFLSDDNSSKNMKNGKYNNVFHIKEEENGKKQGKR